ncbi:MAG: hypothetical protein DRJ03_26450 [Chloroflexi bacterium]|nr:MAG: hypothetical protein DRI81_15055 [Chloroflexota bacterium]RLC77680.1 MAG: hypothetical protein DRJ03_26450 [Chloroflexota bacterium]
MQICINTERAREVGRQLLAEGDRLAEIGHELQSAIGSLDTGVWDGRSRSRAEPLLDRVRPESEWVKHQLEELGYKLVRVANIFEQEDDTAARNLAGMPWVDFETGGGDVLGVATAAGMTAPTIILASLPLTGDYAPDISKMSWAERFDYAKTLPGQIESLEGEQQKLKDQIVQDDRDITDLDQQIQDLQNKRDALQEKAGGFLNKVKRDPDGWQWGFDDGLLDAPWRTKSDALEDEIAGYDRQIQELQVQRDVLAQQRQDHQQKLDSINQQLATSRQSQADVEQIIQNGIPLDGPSPKHPYFPGTITSNCTKYASSKRNVPCSGNAYEWNEQARAGNFETGNHPIKGAVMVMEPNVKGADATNGHVAIVESVEKLSDGSLKVWYTDNGNPTQPTWRIIEPGVEEISFIYDKPPESTLVA